MADWFWRGVTGWAIGQMAWGFVILPVIVTIGLCWFWIYDRIRG